MRDEILIVMLNLYVLVVNVSVNFLKVILNSYYSLFFCDILLLRQSSSLACTMYIIIKLKMIEWKGNFIPERSDEVYDEVETSFLFAWFIFHLSFSHEKRNRKHRICTSISLVRDLWQSVCLHLISISMTFSGNWESTYVQHVSA